MSEFVDPHSSNSWPSLTRSQRLEADVLNLLTQRVRVLGDYQLSSLPRRETRRLFRRLLRRDLVSLRTIVMPPPLILSMPVILWRPGDPPPAFDRAAWQIRARWKSGRRVCTVASATAKAAAALGSGHGARPLRRTEVVHDLHVTALYLKLSNEFPERATQWIHEDDACRSGRAGDLVPDALIGGHALEFGGAYCAAKLRAIHRGHAAIPRAYEIW